MVPHMADRVFARGDKKTTAGLEATFPFSLFNFRLLHERGVAREAADTVHLCAGWTKAMSDDWLQTVVTEPRFFVKCLLEYFEILLAAHGVLVRLLLGGITYQEGCQEAGARCTHTNEVLSDGGSERGDCAAQPALLYRRLNRTARAAQ